MDKHWVCKNCGSEVPNNFDVCWKCEAKMNEIITNEQEEKYFSKADYNLSKIHAAGGQLKNVARTVVFLVFFHIIFTIIERLSEGLKAGYYYLYYIVLLICAMILAGIIFSAGETLQEVILGKKKEKPKS